MLNLVCKIEIVSKKSAKVIRFDYVYDLVVTTSCKNLTDTAVVKVPRKMQWKGKPLTDYINRDDVITIEIGYSPPPAPPKGGGDSSGLETVFKGYISGIENGFPIVISCENEMRLFKTINVPAEKIEKFDLKAYIEKYGGVKVNASEDVSFGGMDIREEMTLARALDEVMKVYPYVKGYFQDGAFCAVLDPERWGEGRKAIVFDTTCNMISDNLTYTLAEDVRIGVKAESILRDNSRLNAYAPAEAFDKSKGKDGKDTFTIKSDYAQRQFYNPHCTTQAELQAYADKMAAELVVDSMSGSFTAFGVPYVRKGDIVELRDVERLERNGKCFLVDGVVYNFGSGGYRQVVTLGARIGKGVGDG